MRIKIKNLKENFSNRFNRLQKNSIELEVRKKKIFRQNKEKIYAWKYRREKKKDAA